MRHGSPQVVRAFVATMEIKPLNTMREATGQDHSSVAIDGQAADIGHQPILPGDFRIEPARTSGAQDLDPDQHSESRRADQERTVRQKAEMGDRLDGLETASRLTVAIDEVHGPKSIADRDITPVGIDCQERRLGSGRRNVTSKSALSKSSPASSPSPSNAISEPSSLIAPATILWERGKRQRFPAHQQIKPVTLIPGENPARLTGEGHALEGGFGDDGPTRHGLQPARCSIIYLGHKVTCPLAMALVARDGVSCPRSSPEVLVKARHPSALCHP